MTGRVGRLALAVATLVVLAGCSLGGDPLLGGRERCWPEEDPRLTSVWRGTLDIDAAGGRLRTPEGDVFTLLPGTLTTRVGGDGTGELVQGGDVRARHGDDVTLFGGLGDGGTFVVCGVEEIHATG